MPWQHGPVASITTSSVIAVRLYSASPWLPDRHLSEQGVISLSQHNISGSEAFKRGPFILIRTLPSGGRRRRRMRVILAFAAGATAATVGALIAALTVFGPGITGG